MRARLRDFPDDRVILYRLFLHVRLLTGTFRVHGEQVLNVRFAFFQSVSGDFDFFRVTHLSLADGDLERRVHDVLTHPLDGHHVLADFSGRERYACGTDRVRTLVMLFSTSRFYGTKCSEGSENF